MLVGVDVQVISILFFEIIYGDTVMAYRGFNMSETVAMYGAK